MDYVQKIARENMKVMNGILNAKVGTIVKDVTLMVTSFFSKYLIFSSLLTIEC